MRSKALFLALLAPLLGVAGLMVRGELTLQTGTEWAVRIGGYDPRDLIRGHYLVYSLRWQMEGRSCTGGDCCYCLWDSGRGGPRPPEPAVRIISCAERAPCESWFPEEQVRGLEKFFIPEGKGRELEQAIRAREAMLLIRVSRRGRVGIADLLLDRRPWSEVVR
jgi:uncharacterized membrane-anchored protein